MSSSPDKSLPQQQQQQQHQQTQPLQQQDSSFPLKEILLTSGVLSVLGMFYFYRTKQTMPYKVSRSDWVTQALAQPSGTRL
mgnify:CR=1 FL=1